MFFFIRKRIMDRIEEKAYGKINLSLDVIGRRENGYHDVSMVMQTVDIYDIIAIRKLEGEDVINLTTDVDNLPVNEDNIVYKAIKFVKEKYKINAGVSAHIEKHLPIAAGMGGGSADAAAALRGMNRLFSLGLDSGELEKIGVNLGADVPFLIKGGIALAEGIGEKLTALLPFPECSLVIVKPGISVSTKETYEDFDNLNDVSHPDIKKLVTALGNKNLGYIVKLLGNVLEGVTVKKHIIIEDIKQLLLENGAIFSMMTGSGPTVFGIFDTGKKAEIAGAMLSKSSDFEMVKVTRCVDLQ